MEQAIFISQVNNLKCVTGDFSRLYFGIEFCQNLMPDTKGLEKVLRYVFEKKKEFTFVTPYLTDKGMEKIKSVLSYLIDRRVESEIVVNDWGLLRWLSREYPDSNLVLGRLLNKQKRGPRILNLAGKVPGNMFAHFQKSNIDSRMFSDFLKRKGVNRVELDNHLQGLDRPKNSLKGSLYFPFAYITTTRFCLINACLRDNSKALRGIYECSRSCLENVFKLQHKHMPVDLYLRGNTQFFKNEHIPENLSALNIDRLVFEPEIPL